MLYHFRYYFEERHEPCSPIVADLCQLQMACSSRHNCHSLCGKGQHAPGAAILKLALSNCCSYPLAFCSSYADVVDVSVDAAQHLAPACLAYQDYCGAEYSAHSNEQVTS